jgi:hypothetical protein
MPAKLLALALLFAPMSLWAQAWTTPRGESNFGLFYQYTQSDTHINREGKSRTDLGNERIHSLVVVGSYGLSERFSIEGSLVSMATSWTGDQADRHGPLDTGSYHGAVQDFRGALLYQLTSGKIAVAPFVAVIIPSNDYETRGHSAFGRQLSALQLGATAGGFAGRSAYWQVGASYSFLEKVEGVDLDLDQINGDLEFGLMVGRRVTIRGFGLWQVMRDGLELGPQTEHLELSPIHDRLARSSYLNLGAGTSIELRPNLDLDISAMVTTTARNFHSLETITTGLVWRSGGDFKVIPASRDRRR